MLVVILIVFVVGYALIALEHTVHVNKTAIAMLTGILCWVLFMFTPTTEALKNSEEFQTFQEEHLSKATTESVDSVSVHHEFVVHSLEQHLGDVSQILFFLLGAMTIVELIDAHHGFRFITDKITTKNPGRLLWMITGVTFFLSAVLDNLTTSIVMVSLTRKLVPDRTMRLHFAGMIVVAANAGGAWTPIGDVTTTMLWIGGQISATGIMRELLIPSLACAIVPVIYMNWSMRKAWHNKELHTDSSAHAGDVRGSKLMLILGVGALVSVPIFKTITHLPPYAGILFGLSLLWIVSEIIHTGLDDEAKRKYTVAGALSRVDVPSVLFFLWILLAVGALESLQLLNQFAVMLDDVIGNNSIIITLIGVFSAIVDNVPLVGATMGMYSLTAFPQDHMIWVYLAYCAGTGGSLLIIGSAAGVAVMGLEKIDFIWYFRKFTFLALLGYAAGAIAYFLINAV